MITPQIELTGVNKHYGAFHALKQVDLQIRKGSFVALVGPSGCGKSTLLRSLAGLERISSGTISIAGQVVNDMPPRKRDLAMVFQTYALYPHMNVEQNLTYSLRLKGVDKARTRKAAEEVAAIIGLGPLLARYPRELSGGQRQRVAMGRAIIREPKAFLFDEPLSNLDAALRVQMRKEIRRLHDRLGATSVYVTHDQIEAMTMADEVVVLRDGVIEQHGAPLELYDRPANRFVAGFMGSPAMNFLPARVGQDGRSVVVELGGRQEIRLLRALAPATEVIVGLRPEHLALAGEGAAAMSVPVGVVESTGSSTFISTATDPELTIVHNGRSGARPGHRVSISIDPAQVHVFDATTQARL